MSFIGLLLIVLWILICLFSPLIGMGYDKWKKIDKSSTKTGSGSYEVRYSAVLVVMVSTPLLIIGLILNWLGQYF